MLKLSNYQIASAFKPILSHIYKAKMEEINQELQPVYNHLDRLAIPRYSDFDRWLACQCVNDRQKMLFNSIDHIQRIRRIKVNETTDSKQLDIQAARQVPIETLYEFKRKGKNVSCIFHGTDKNPSVSLRNNKYHCFTCGLHLDSIAFMMKLNNVGFKEAVGMLTQ